MTHDLAALVVAGSCQRAPQHRASLRSSTTQDRDHRRSLATCGWRSGNVLRQSRHNPGHDDDGRVNLEPQNRVPDNYDFLSVSSSFSTSGLTTIRVCTGRNFIHVRFADVKPATWDVGSRDFVVCWTRAVNQRRMSARGKCSVLGDNAP